MTCAACPLSLPARDEDLLTSLPFILILNTTSERFVFGGRMEQAQRVPMKAQSLAGIAS
jgi:hypothetical protein